MWINLYLVFLELFMIIVIYGVKLLKLSNLHMNFINSCVCVYLSLYIYIYYTILKCIYIKKGI